ncbi:hypothetical protein ACWEPB_02605 [Kitasatospora cineracea]
MTDAPDDLGITLSQNGTPLLWERHGSTVAYTSVPRPPQPPQMHTTLPGQELQP